MIVKHETWSCKLIAVIDPYIYIYIDNWAVFTDSCGDEIAWLYFISAVLVMAILYDLSNFRTNVKFILNRIKQNVAKRDISVTD